MKKKLTNKFEYFIIFIPFISVFVFSSINIIMWIKDNRNTNKEMEKIINIVPVIERKDTNNTEIIENDQPKDKSDPYWDYIKTPLIDVNFNKLKETNKDIIGWINITNTNINYPIVQTSNNSYYLIHSINKKKNKAGWIFMDYRNNPENLDSNTIIYGHARVNNTMFGTLKKVVTNNKDNLIRISTDKENSLWQIFSAYSIKETNDYLNINFESKKDYKTFIDLIINRSQKNYKTKVNTNDKIITLSTCHKTNERYVVHAKLIKTEKK